MSADLGAVQAGFVNNFAYGTISLTSSTSVELVDQSHNTTSTSPEAVYANELIVPSGATLNLNNLHLYVRGDQISGTIVGGTVTVVPSGGSIALNTPTPGTLTPAGATDDWTFYGTAGESITVQLNPGGGGTNPALSPSLNWGQVALLNAGGNALATASSASSGAIATISGFALPASGTYTIQVQAPAGREHQHRQLRARGLRRHAQRQLPDRQPAVHRHDRECLRRRSVRLHRRRRPAGRAPRDQLVRRRRVRPDRTRGLHGLHRPLVQFRA